MVEVLDVDHLEVTRGPDVVVADRPGVETVGDRKRTGGPFIPNARKLLGMVVQASSQHVAEAVSGIWAKQLVLARPPFWRSRPAEA
jgi:hypothetical protein